ncbi:MULTISPECIES: M15 family metallopeptidase [Paraburkholderia]|uniref:M15 family metallopeptidase n=1 Tax=Paraburkholderia TaxID=1822464 RepID=UPI000B3FBA93|nr:M15 family metallopeptidase [Paraburkholderia caledonica]
MHRILNERELTGRSRTHVTQFDEPRFAAQREVGDAFIAMREDARRAGIDLVPYSGFRGFRMQLRIWNDKFSGRKPLYDMSGNVRDFSTLTPSEVIDCILNWSALPGGSRHQWGTEIDVVDAAATPTDYVVKLLPKEVGPAGVFARLHHWLDDNMGRFGFFRPYDIYRGGMYPEPWHLSYAPLAAPALQQITAQLLIDVISRTDMLGKDLVLERISDIYQNHIQNVARPPQYPEY